MFKKLLAPAILVVVLTVTFVPTTNAQTGRFVMMFSDNTTSKTVSSASMSGNWNEWVKWAYAPNTTCAKLIDGANSGWFNPSASLGMYFTVTTTGAHTLTVDCGNRGSAMVSLSILYTGPTAAPSTPEPQPFTGIRLPGIWWLSPLHAETFCELERRLFNYTPDGCW